MIEAEKLAQVKVMLGISDTSSDSLLTYYLNAAAREIIGWRYSYVDGWDSKYTTVPPEYEQTQIAAVIFGYSIRGAEGEKSHNENGISRTFSYSDMIGYIRAHVIPVAGV